MANTDKDIVITPNKGQTNDPSIAFSGANSTVTAQTIFANVYPFNGGTISFEGSAGQLFSITNSLTGTIFSVNDISGIPSITVNSAGNVVLAQYNGNVTVGGAQGQAANVMAVVGNLYVSGNAYVARNQFVTGNVNSYGSNNIMGGKLGVGTTSATGANSNAMAVYGTAMVYGNIMLQNQAAGGSGIYFADGTFQVTAAGSTYSNVNVASYLSGPVVIGNLTISNTTASTSTTTGALLMGGGAGIQGAVHIGGLIYGASTLNIAGAAQVNSLIGNTNIFSATMNTSGLAQHASMIVNANTTSATLNVTGAAQAASFISNGTIQSIGAVTVASLISNANTTTATLNSTGAAQVSSLIVNTNTTSATLNVTGAAIVNSLTSNVYGLFGQNVTINSANASTTTGTGALIITTGGAGIAGNVNAGGSRNLFTNYVGVGTSAALGLGNVLSVYGTENLYGNLRLANTAAGGSGIYFADGTFMTTAATGSGSGTPGGSNTNIQYNNSGTLGGSNGFVFFGNTTSVGIGTSAPGYSLDVWGNIHIGNNAGQSNGIVFPDGTKQTSAANTNIQTFTFTATANQTTFSVFPYTPSDGNSINYTMVFVNGVYQRTSTYAWTGTNIILAAGAPQFARVEVKITTAMAVGNYTVQPQQSNAFTVASAGVTTWSTGFTYSTGYLDVYVNGIKKTSNVDYTATTGNSVTFTVAPSISQNVQFIGWLSQPGFIQVQSSNVFNVQTSGVTVWNTGFPYTVGLLSVYVNGLLQVSGTDYTATTGTSVSFTSSPAINSIVTFVGWNNGSTLGQLATQRKAFYVASAGQTTFAAQGGYQSPYVDVYVNGIKMVYLTDYTAADGNTVVLTSGLAAGSNVEIVSNLTYMLGDMVRRSGDTFTGNVGIGTSIANVPFSVVGQSNFYGNITIQPNNYLVFPDGSSMNSSAAFQIQPIDNIGNLFDSITTQFGLKVNGSNINIASPLQVILSVGGMVLAPFITTDDYLDMPEVTIFDRGYKLSGNTLTLANAPRYGQDFSARVISSTPPAPSSVSTPFKPLSIAMADS